MTIRAAVVGATGYAGAELVRILTDHPEVSLTVITSRQFEGVPFSDVYPGFTGVVDQACASFLESRICSEADVVFLALPHKASMEVAPGLIDGGVKVIDLSADFRFQDVSAYEKWYEPHLAKELIPSAVYGLCEVNKEAIKGARLIGNPGCYPTSVLLPLIPLVKAGLIDLQTIIADSKSGTSGAGRSPNPVTHFCAVNEGFKAYGVAEHRHNPEMNEVLTRFSGEDVRMTFVPHLVPMTRGMLTTLYVGLKDSVSHQDVRERLESFYKEKIFVRVYPQNRYPNTRDVKGTNYCDIGMKVVEGTRQLILVSAIDNLVKGASGQAVQNMNIMYGFPEAAGLTQAPYPL